MKNLKLYLAVGVVAAMFIGAAVASRKKPQPLAEQPKKNPIQVEVKSASSAHSFQQTVSYPGTVVGEQEIKIVAKSGGIAQAVNFNLGDRVGLGSTLVRIDDNGNNLDSAVNGFQSSQVQQSSLAAKQAKKAYELAKDSYENLKDSDAATSAQVDAAKTQRDIAKLQYENATIGFNSTLDSKLITSPIAGTVTKKAVSTGDAVSAGQLLAVISKTNNVKVQFYVDQDQQKKLTRGQEIEASEGDQKLSLVVRNISPVADLTTKRFLIEAYPKAGTFATSGTLVNVELTFEKSASDKNNLVLPLSAVTVGQNENYIFVAENGKAKKTLVDIEKVDGETAEISFEYSGDPQIIIEGNKLVQDGEEISLNN